MQGADREILEHPAELRDVGTVARMVPDGRGCAGSEDRCARRTDSQAFSRRGGGRGTPQPKQLFAQLGGVGTWRRFYFDLVLGELTADQIAKGCASKTATRAPAGSGIRV
jgi:hypothetical protein